MKFLWNKLDACSTENVEFIKATHDQLLLETDAYVIWKRSPNSVKLEITWVRFGVISFCWSLSAHAGVHCHIL